METKADTVANYSTKIAEVLTRKPLKLELDDSTVRENMLENNCMTVGKNGRFIYRGFIGRPYEDNERKRQSSENLLGVFYDQDRKPKVKDSAFPGDTRYDLVIGDTSIEVYVEFFIVMNPYDFADQIPVEVVDVTINRWFFAPCWLTEVDGTIRTWLNCQGRKTLFARI